MPVFDAVACAGSAWSSHHRDRDLRGAHRACFRKSQIAHRRQTFLKASTSLSEDAENVLRAEGILEVWTNPSHDFRESVSDVPQPIQCDNRQHEEEAWMFMKFCLVSILAFLIGVLTTQRAQQIVHAQTRIEYRVVETEVFLTPDGKAVPGGQNVKYFSTQDALDQYGKDGWELVTASYDRDSGPRRGHLIFMRK
jgi:hypothetical protein